MHLNSDNSSTTTERRDIQVVRKLAGGVVTIFVIFMSIIAIGWLVIHPHEPIFRITSLSVTDFTVPNNKDSQLKGKYEVELAIRNPNKVEVQVVIDPNIMLVLYDQEWRSMASVQHVFLEKRENKSVKVDLEVEQSSKKVPQELVKDWKKRVVNFNVKFSVEVRFESRHWPSMDKLLDVDCEDLDVFFSAKDKGRLLGVGKDCHITDAVQA